MGLPLLLVGMVVLAAYLTFRSEVRRAEARRVSVSVRALHPAKRPARRHEKR